MSDPLLVYLDSRDLIDLERGRVDAESFPSLFTAAHATLVLSHTIVNELIEPLRHLEGGSVTRLMNILEATPHRWLRTVDLEGLELARALGAFDGGRTPVRLDPFCASYVDTGFVDARTQRHYRGKSLAAIVWDEAYGERTSIPHRSRADRFPELVLANRQFIQTLSPSEYRTRLREQFGEKVRSLLGHSRSSEPFLDFLWDHADWCPSTRLGFEVYHALVRDRLTVPNVNDVNDLTHILALPYVDVFTADGAKRNLLQQLKTRPELAGMEHLEASAGA